MQACCPQRQDIECVLKVPSDAKEGAYDDAMGEISFDYCMPQIAGSRSVVHEMEVASSVRHRMVIDAVKP